MSTPDKDNLPPPYTEYIQSLPDTSTANPVSLLTQLSQTRTNHVQSIINTLILPHIIHRITQGLPQTTIALVPRTSSLPIPDEKRNNEFAFDNKTESTTTTSDVEILGFASDEQVPHIIRLTDPLDTPEFWRPRQITEELERWLNDALNTQRGNANPTRSTTRAANELPRGQGKRKFFQRLSGKGPEVPSASGNPEVGIREGRGDAAGGGKMVVRVRLEEVCFRTVTAFGLYDTLSERCVIVRVDARC